MPALSKVTVLILDDNPLVLKLGRALLEREGCTVLTASSWIEFNHVLAGNTPDIIFLDVNLPSIKGNRLSEVLKSQSNKKDDVGGVACEDVIELDPARRREHGATFTLEQSPAELEHERVVIEDQNCHFR